MKIKYEFATGETKEIEVDEKLYNESKEIDRQIYNNNQAETRRHCTIEKSLEFGTLASGFNIETAFTKSEESKKLYEALCTLSPNQKDLVSRVFFNGQSLKEVAIAYGTSYQAVQNKLNKILEKLLKQPLY